MSSLKGKVIALTGAASGMGRATALHFAAQGAILSLADANAALLQSLAEELSAGPEAPQVLTSVLDVRDRKAVDDWISQTVEKFGPLDGAANLAGVIGKQQNKAGIEDIDDDDWDFVMAVNVGGVKNAMRAQIPHFKEGGSIVNAASVAGMIGLKNCGAYVASKHAVLGLTKVAAKELGVRGIRVNAVSPGPIATPMLSDSAERRDKSVKPDYTTALPRLGQPAEVAALLAFLLGDDSRFITGSNYQIDGGLVC